jgi:hypothetical protein
MTLPHIVRVLSEFRNQVGTDMAFTWDGSHVFTGQDHSHPNKTGYQGPGSRGPKSSGPGSSVALGSSRSTGEKILQNLTGEFNQLK